MTTETCRINGCERPGDLRATASVAEDDTSIEVGLPVCPTHVFKGVDDAVLLLKAVVQEGLL